jgi:DNA-binding HxlR family transcriptional regulator
MDMKDIKRFVAEKGFRTMNEIRSNFPKENQEILTMNLNVLMSKNALKRVKFTNSQGSVEELFYIPS